MEKMTTQFSPVKIYVPNLGTFELHYPQAVAAVTFVYAQGSIIKH